MDPFISLLLVLLPPFLFLPVFFAFCDGLIWRVRPSSTAITVGQPISIRAIASGIQRAAQGFPTFSYVLLCVGSLLSRLMLVVDKLRTAVSYELTSILLRGWEPLCYEEDIHISDWRAERRKSVAWKTLIPSKRRFGDNLAEEERKEGEIGDYISSFLDPLWLFCPRDADGLILQTHLETNSFSERSLAPSRI